MTQTMLQHGQLHHILASPRQALLVTGAAPLVALGGGVQMKIMFGLSSSSDKLYATANTAVGEAVSSIRVIQVSTCVRRSNH